MQRRNYMADQTFKGVIAEFFEREWKDKNTGKDIILRSFKLNSENRFFRSGTTELNYSVGDAIQFVADGKGNVDLKTVEKIDASDAPPPKSSTSSSPRAGGGGSAGYWEKKAQRDQEVTEPRIAYSAAQKNATALVVAALNAEILSFGQASKGKKLDMLVDFVEQTTIRLAQLQQNAPEILKEVE
jgi:hypothetical protein